MLQSPLSRADAEQIAGMLNAARQIVSSADGLYKAGMIGEGMVESLMDVQGELGKWLAFFTDGRGYGWARPDAVVEMRDIEYQTCKLLFHISEDAIAAERRISS